MQLRKRDGQLIGYEYDVLNRLSIKYMPAPFPTVRYAYDLRGLQTAAWFPGNSWGVSNAWEGFARLTSTTTNMGGFRRTVAHEYDHDGRRTEIAFPDNQKWTKRDGLGRATDQGPLGSTSLPSPAVRDALRRSFSASTRHDQTRGRGPGQRVGTAAPA